MYDQQILKILTEVGERGISVGMLAKHIYNQQATFFFSPRFYDIHQYVQQYLLRNSKSSQSLIESTGRRGFYRLNTQGSADARQLMLDFRDEPPQDDIQDKTAQQDLSLSLFPDTF